MKRMGAKPSAQGLAPYPQQTTGPLSGARLRAWACWERPNPRRHKVSQVCPGLFSPHLLFAGEANSSVFSPWL